MQVAGLDKLSYTEMQPSWEPFFATFPHEVDGDARKKIIQGIVEHSSRMIAKALQRQKKLFKEHRQ